MTGPRADVIELLAYHHPSLSDLTAKPWRLYHLDDGRAFTPAESALANSATPAEVLAAQQLALAEQERLRRKIGDGQRVLQLLRRIPGWEERQIVDTLALLPEAEQAEAAGILSRYTLEELWG